MATAVERNGPFMDPDPDSTTKPETESFPTKSIPTNSSFSTSDDHSVTGTSPPTSTASTLPTIPSDEDRASSTSSSADEETPAVPAPEPAMTATTSPTLAVPAKSNAASAGRDRSSSGGGTRVSRSRSSSGVQKLSAADMKELTNAPESLPVAHVPEHPSIDQDMAAQLSDQREFLRPSLGSHPDLLRLERMQMNGASIDSRTNGGRSWQTRDLGRRPSPAPRTVSTPPTSRVHTSFEANTSAYSPRRYSFNPSNRPPPLSLGLDGMAGHMNLPIHTGPATTPTPGIKTPNLSSSLQESPVLGGTPAINRPPSPLPNKIPLPPMSIPTHLQLEIAAQRPSPLYIHHPHSNDIPYESSAVKLERLKNVLVLPPYLERTLNFGALACLDAWLYNFTILPIRFVLAVAVLVRWWAYMIAKETRFVIGFVWDGIGRLRERGRSRSSHRNGAPRSDADRSRSRSTASEFSVDVDIGAAPTARFKTRPRGDSRTSSNGHMRAPQTTHANPGPRSGSFRHRRTKSMPSNLTAFHKADILQGLVILLSSMMLMSLDASRMYHFIRAQSAIKLYVIYNILEVGDRLLSALGQDILECLFSSETLSRNASGRSKVLLPLGMFLLALTYNCLHSVALYYQVITLNVAVNSYSNALLTLLLSNQFVEIKSTVFKRFEKDNLFQLTCADIVERFQLWIMLFIIGLRNVVEVGGLSVPGAGIENSDDETAMPMHNPSILPHSFTVLPSWMMSGEVLSPFLIVIGSEMLVDSIKHAYVTKFNNIKPGFYGRILDILCRDYYTNAFMTPSLTRRLGLAVIPLSCLFIRASVQTYHMFLSTHLPMPMPPSTQTSLAAESATPSSPAMIAALNRFDSLIRDSLGRATYGHPRGDSMGPNARPWYSSWTTDDVIAAVTMTVFFFITFLVLLIIKLLLGMVLLKYSRNRYAEMKRREALLATKKNAERESYDAPGRRSGGYGSIEVGEERQRWIHADETEGLPGGKGIGGKRSGGGGGSEEKRKQSEGEYNGVFRYDMVAKRIW